MTFDSLYKLIKESTSFCYKKEAISRLFLCESFDNEIATISSYGYELVDRYDIDDYIIFLIKSPTGDFEIGITSHEQDFTSSDAQKKKQPKNSGLLRIKTKLYQIIDRWLDQYPILYIGSMNKERTELYHRIFGKFFHVSNIKHSIDNVGFDESWDFHMTKNENQFTS
jgi:hypothetical protein